MCKEENLRDKFKDSFTLWCRAIASYCKLTQIKSSALQAETKDYCEDLDSGKYTSNNLFHFVQSYSDCTEYFYNVNYKLCVLILGPTSVAHSITDASHGQVGFCSQQSHSCEN